jgi:hypothetical protein
VSEANQNWYSAEPCQSYQTEHGNMTVKATKKGFTKKNEKTKKTQGSISYSSEFYRLPIKLVKKKKQAGTLTL